MSDNDNDDEDGSENGETNENNAFHIASKAGNLANVQSLVSNFDINTKGAEDGTALYWAAREVEVVKLLLSLNADVNIPDVSPLEMRFIRLFSTSPILCIVAIPFFLHFLTCLLL